MKTLKIFFIGIAIIFSGMVHAQKIKLVSGNMSFIKGQKVLKVVYNYDDMKVGKMDEDKYVSTKVKEYNQDIPGKGDNWQKAWINDRTSRFQPKFELLFNKYLKEKGVSIHTEAADAKYTLLLKTTMTEPGFNVYVSSRPAMINTEVIFTETANPEKVLAKITITGSPGNTMGNDYDTGNRIQEAYAKCGKALAKYLIKTALK
ncbi:hypothetical protein ACFLRZ_00325 [Bacteroidota bacterium]